MSLIELIGLQKSYQSGAGVRVEALRGINLKIEQGDYFSVMGSSGSGKSTLLNILGCLDRPTEGCYLLDGRDISDFSDDELSEVRSRQIGFVFQSFNLIQQLTVLENIQVPLFYQGTDRSKRKELASILAERVGLEGRLDHRPMELSGGQQQRVAVARALVNDPLVILADEPTGNLDYKTGLEILEIFDDLTERGRTIIMVTHDESVGKRSRHIVQMGDGKIIGGK